MAVASTTGTRRRPGAHHETGGSDNSSVLSDLDVQSTADGEASGLDADADSEDQMSQAEEEFENETEAETERLDISPQKPGQTNGVVDKNAMAEPDPGLTAQDILGEDIDGNEEVQEDEEMDMGAESPSSLAGRKRKRDGQLSSPPRSIEELPLRKRTSGRRTLADTLPDKPPLIEDEEANAEASEDEDTEAALPVETAFEDDAALEEVDDALKEDSGDEVEVEGDEAEDEEAEDEEADEIDAAAKSEAELARKKAAYDSFKPIEKLFAIFRDKVFNERWAELSAELDILNEDDTSHAEYLLQRAAVDVRRDEKIRLEGVALRYRQKCLEHTAVASRAQIFSQCYQRIREVRETCLSELNRDFCQIQRERRKFQSFDPHFIVPFETDRAKQVLNQTKYNKEVSLLSGIALHRGFPAAPEIKSASREDADADFRAMRITTAVAPSRSVSYNQLAQSAKADEAAAEQIFMESTPWANPNHPALQYARLMEQQGHRVPAGTPPVPQPQPQPQPQARPGWMAEAYGPSSERPPAPNMFPKLGDDPRRDHKGWSSPLGPPGPKAAEYARRHTPLAGRPVKSPFQTDPRPYPWPEQAPAPAPRQHSDASAHAGPAYPPLRQFSATPRAEYRNGDANGHRGRPAQPPQPAPPPHQPPPPSHPLYAPLHRPTPSPVGHAQDRPAGPPYPPESPRFLLAPGPGGPILHPHGPGHGQAL